MDDVPDLFDPYDLAELEVAEHECPWGEMAENYRMMYLAAAMQECMAGSKESATEAFNRAQRIWIKLFGVQPSRRPPRAADFVRD